MWSCFEKCLMAAGGGGAAADWRRCLPVPDDIGQIGWGKRKSKAL